MKDEPHGILDNFWASFLHDYDNIEDGRNSIYSLDDSFISDQHENVKEDRSVAKRGIVSKRNGQYEGSKNENVKEDRSVAKRGIVSKRNGQYEGLKNENVKEDRSLAKRGIVSKRNGQYEGLKNENVKEDRSLAKRGIVSKRNGQYEGLKNENVKEDRSAAKRGIVSKRNGQYEGLKNENVKEDRSVAKRGIVSRSNGQYEESKMSNRVDSFEQLTELFSKDHLQRSTSRYDESAIKRHIGTDLDLQREGPPTTIFVEKQSVLSNMDRSNKVKSGRRRIISTGLRSREIDLSIIHESSTYDDGCKGQNKFDQGDEEREEIRLTAVQRKELIRKIALLKIRATKARMARADK
eukprot:jgi/Psemu1/288846/fgenesh1_pg.293_\